MAYGSDLVVLLVVALAASLWALWSLWRLDKVLRDTDHPWHEDYKDALDEREL